MRGSTKQSFCWKGKIMNQTEARELAERIAADQKVSVLMLSVHEMELLPGRYYVLYCDQQGRVYAALDNLMWLTQRALLMQEQEALMQRKRALALAQA